MNQIGRGRLLQARGPTAGSEGDSMFRIRFARFRSGVGRRFFKSIDACGWVWLLVLLFGFTTTSCRSNSTIAVDDPLADRSFLTQQPCAAPCWYGLEPDKSTLDDVMATLRKLPSVDSSSIWEGTVYWGGDEGAKQIGFSCLHPKDQRCGGGFIFSRGVVKRISLTPAYELTFQMAVDRIGNPDYLEYRPYSPHGEGCWIGLYWARGIILQMSDRSSWEQCQEIQRLNTVSPIILVDDITYITRDAFAPPPKGMITSKTPFPGFTRH